MDNKFTYFDFMMYIVPGGLLEAGLLAAVRLSKFGVNLSLPDSAVSQTVLFIFAAFVLGHFVQTIAHWFPEWALKRIFWRGYYPSQVVLFSMAKLLSDTERAHLIDQLGKAGLADSGVTEQWNREKRYGAAKVAKAREVAQAAFVRVRAKLAGKNARVESAEAYYQFFRGSATAGLLSALGLVAAWLFADAGRMAVAAAGGAMVLSASFFWRARGAGQNLAREVIRNVDVLLPQREPAAGGGGQ